MWPNRSTVDSADAKHSVLTRAIKLYDKRSQSDRDEQSEENSLAPEIKSHSNVNKKGPQRTESYFMHSLGGDKGHDSDSESIEQVEVTKKKNRAGQRTRRRLAEEMRHKGQLGPAPTSHKRAFSELAETDPVAVVKTVKRRKLEHDNSKKEQLDHQYHAGEEVLHPSWSAIKKSKESQRVVLGNAKEHVVFDSDEE